MDHQRVKTPPILDWLVVSLPGSSDEEIEDSFPFETVSQAVEKLQTLVCNEWMYEPSETFELKRKSMDSGLGYSEDKNNLNQVCAEIIRNMNDIVRESEDREDYLEQYSLFQSLNSTIKKT
jgi:hypothetical protein